MDEVDSAVVAGGTVVDLRPVEGIAVATVAGVAAMRPTKGLNCLEARHASEVRCRLDAASRWRHPVRSAGRELKCTHLS